MKTKILIALALSLFLAASVPQTASAGSETRNGGSIIIDGQKYEIADLHFIPLPHDLFEMAPALSEKIREIKSVMEGKLNLSLYGGKFGRSTNFFESVVFSPLVEYRLVGALPSDCTFIPQENLPYNKVRENIACTRGQVTYLLPGAFSKLDLLQQALLIIHERLHAFAPDQPYDLKTDVINAMYILSSRWLPACANPTPEFRFTETELKYLNLLQRRVSQLNNSPSDQLPIQITAQGSLFIGQVEIIGNDILIGVGSILRNARIKGNRIQIFGSQVLEGQIEGNDLRILDSYLVPRFDSVKQRGIFSGNQVQVIRSKIENVSAQDSLIVDSRVIDSSVSSAKITSSTVYRVQGREIEISQSKVLSETWDRPLTIKVERLKIESSNLSGDIEISGTDIHLIGITASSSGSYKGSCETERKIKIQGSRIFITHSSLELFSPPPKRPWGDRNPLVCTPGPKELSKSVFVGVQIQGVDISLNRFRAIGAGISGSRIQIDSQTLMTQVSERPADFYPYENLYTDTRIPTIQAQGLSITGTRFAQWPMRIEGNEIEIKASILPAMPSLIGKSLKILSSDLSQTTLDLSQFSENLHIEQVTFESPESPMTIGFLSDTRLQAIRSFKSDRPTILFGKPAATTTLDGKDRSYHVKKSAWTSTAKIRSQKDLEEWAE